MPQPIDPFYEDAKRAFVLASDYEVLEARVSALEADNASLRASLVEFKGDYGKLVDLEGQAQARVAALEADMDGLAEDAELHRKRAYTLGVAYLDEVVDDEAPRPSKQYTFEETVLIARAAVAALHPTSEAEL